MTIASLDPQYHSIPLALSLFLSSSLSFFHVRLARGIFSLAPSLNPFPACRVPGVLSLGDTQPLGDFFSFFFSETGQVGQGVQHFISNIGSSPRWPAYLVALVVDSGVRTESMLKVHGGTGGETGVDQPQPLTWIYAC